MPSPDTAAVPIDRPAAPAAEAVAAAPRPRPVVPGLRWMIIGLVFLATVINYVDRQTMNVLAPVILRDLGLSKAAFGTVTAAFLLAYTVGMAVWGRLVDRIGTRAAFALAITIWSVAAGLHALAAGFVGLVAFRGLLAFGEAGNWPGAAKCVAEWFPARERALGMAIFNSGVALGAVVAPPIIVAMQIGLGWRSTFLMTGALGFVWLAAWLALFRTPDRHPWLGERERALIRGADDAVGARAAATADAGRPQTFRALLRRRQVWAIVLGRLCTDPVWWLYITWLPQYLADERGFDLKAIGTFAWIPYFAAGMGALAGGWGSGRLMRAGLSLDRARKLCLLAGAALMPAGVLATRVASPAAAIALISVVLFAFQVWMNNVQALPGDFFPPGTVGAVFGLGGVAAGLGSFAFMMLSGFVVERFSYAPMFVAAGVLGPLGAIALFALAGRIERLPPGEAAA